DSRLVAALLDRLTHRCHLLEFQGESYRFRQSMAARQGTPRAASDLTGVAAKPDRSKSAPTGRPTNPAKPRP
ncbi:MAG TPA: ATP-binding protein, partial [Chloroflexota bacterium]|nr:ATP-binding protein [Chloroflexota bacterium]